MKNIKFYTVIGLVFLWAIFSQANAMTENEYFDKASKILHSYQDAMNRFDQLGIMAGQRSLTLKEELQIANSICNIAEAQEKIRKLAFDNPELDQLVFKNDKTRDQQDEIYKKENEPYLQEVNRYKGTPYECGKQNYNSLTK